MCHIFLCIPYKVFVVYPIKVVSRIKVYVSSDGKIIKWVDIKLRASSTIRLAFAPEIKYDALEVNNPKILWEQLAKTYQLKSWPSKLFLKKMEIWEIILINLID